MALGDILHPHAGSIANEAKRTQLSSRHANGFRGWAAFDYDAASDTFKPSDASSTPPQEHDAKCGFACHTIVEKRDYVFTEYGKR